MTKISTDDVVRNLGLDNIITVLNHLLGNKTNVARIDTFSNIPNYEIILKYLEQKKAITKKGTALIKLDSSCIDVLRDLQLQSMAEQQLELAKRQATFNMWLMIATIILAIGTLASVIISLIR